MYHRIGKVRSVNECSCEIPSSEPRKRVLEGMLDKWLKFQKL